MPARRRPVLDRFLEKTDQSGGCWLWKAAVFTNGYAAFRLGSKMVRAHRWAYEHYVGPIPVDAVILHGCDVKRCVNPAHLRIGTQLENQRDMTLKGRGRVGAINGAVLHAPKLSYALADEIRERYADGDVTQAGLANEYSVDQKMISRITRGLSWAH